MSQPGSKFDFNNNYNLARSFKVDMPTTQALAGQAVANFASQTAQLSKLTDGLMAGFAKDLTDSIGGARFMTQILEQNQRNMVASLMPAALGIQKLSGMDQFQKQFLGSVVQPMVALNAVQTAQFAPIVQQLTEASRLSTNITETFRERIAEQTTGFAKTFLESTRAIRAIDAETLASIRLAPEYAEKVEALLDSDPTMAAFAEDATKTFMSRFTMSRERANKSVHVLIWMMMFAAICTGLIAGGPTVATVIGVVCSATGKVNADAVSKAVTNKLIPLDEE